jgi:hypothetical protein
MLQLRGIYENGNITLLEEVPIKKKTPVIVSFITEDAEEKVDYSALDEMLGFCESTRIDAAIQHDTIIYELEKSS